LIPILSVWILRGHVAQTSKSAVSRISKSAGGVQQEGAADLEVGDTAGLETCATLRGFALFQKRYADFVQRIVALRGFVVVAYLVAAILLVWLIGSRLGTEIFPKVEAGQLQ